MTLIEVIPTKLGIFAGPKEKEKEGIMDFGLISDIKIKLRSTIRSNRQSSHNASPLLDDKTTLQLTKSPIHTHKIQPGVVNIYLSRPCHSTLRSA